MRFASNGYKRSLYEKADFLFGIFSTGTRSFFAKTSQARTPQHLSAQAEQHTVIKH